MSSTEVHLSYLSYVLKAIVGAIIAAGGALAIAIAEGSDGGTDITNGEWATIAVAVIVAAAAVFLVPNMDEGIRKVAKAITAGATAFLATFLPALSDGIVTQEWITIGLAVLMGAVAVYFAPNGDKPVAVPAE